LSRKIDSSSSPYTGRFAPSPSGPLHLGSLYTAVASYLEARSRNGVWLLRIDDVDTPRVVPGAADAILRILERLALLWDGPVVRQSLNLPRYGEALMALDAAGLLYACNCSRKTVAKTPTGISSPYPGSCRDAARSRQAPHALRVRTGGSIRFRDRLQGEIVQDLSREVGDFVLRRRDGVYAYHLACVLDDFKSGISEVLRGMDLMDSTPRQILLQSLLGLPSPAYAHIPLVVDQAGIKLSKQSGAPPVDDRHASKVLAEVLTMLHHPPPLQLLGAPPQELLAWAQGAWTLERVGADPALSNHR
jgi:glutamyl-Q tRNA(Asp) synthetase